MDRRRCRPTRAWFIVLANRIGPSDFPVVYFFDELIGCHAHAQHELAKVLCSRKHAHAAREHGTPIHGNGTRFTVITPGFKESHLANDARHDTQHFRFLDVDGFHA